MAVLDDLVFALVTAVVIIAGTIQRPTSARCPDRWYLDTGIRPSGDFRCVPELRGGVNDPAGGIDTAVQPPGQIESRVFCDRGSRPVVADYRTVACRHLGAR